jgi:hypothetical protein
MIMLSAYKNKTNPSFPIRIVTFLFCCPIEQVNLYFTEVERLDVLIMFLILQ